MEETLKDEMMTSIELEKGELYDNAAKMDSRIGVIGHGILGHVAFAQSMAHDLRALIVIDGPIERRNHPRYDTLLEEYALIRQKNSKLSRRKRDDIVSRVHDLIEQGAIVLEETRKH